MTTYEQAADAQDLDYALGAITGPEQLTDVVAQRESDRVAAFCTAGQGHTLVQTETRGDGYDVDVFECSSCGTVLER